MERFIKYALISFGLVFVWMLVGVFSSDVRIGFLGWLAFVFFGTIFITIGSFLGALFRDFVMPDMYMTSGVSDAFNKRIFWAVGPQFIGGLIGLLSCNQFLANVLGMTQFMG